MTDAPLQWEADGQGRQSARMRLKFDVLALPSFDGLPGDLQSALHAADESMARLWINSAVLCASPDPVRRELAAQLTHPLAGMAARRMRGGRDAEPARHKDVAEHVVCREYLEEFMALTGPGGDGVELLQLLVRLNARVRGVPSRIRTRRIFTRSDSRGAFWEYPDHHYIEGAIGDLFGFMHASRQLPALFVGAILITALNCLHPFADGNGRVARIVFNLLLITRGMLPGSHIPCASLFALSGPSFIIHVRYTSLRQDWVPVVQFFVDALRQCELVSNAGILAP